MNKTIYMIRLAKSPFVVGQERTRNLSAQGLVDAKKVADIMDNERIDLIVSSPYKRAIQTIEEIATNKEKEIIVYEQLRERQLKGAFKLTEEEIHQAINTSFEDIDFQLTDGESIRDVQNRAIPVIKDLLNKYEGKTIIVGTHGNVMTIIMNYFDKAYGYEFWENTSKPEIYKLVLEGEDLLSVHRLWE